tara:strand:+ start:286 stop:432 length:147 start_codon:yes stop_codon:yes gene_type:complete
VQVVVAVLTTAVPADVQVLSEYGVMVYPVAEHAEYFFEVAAPVSIQVS